MTVSCRRCRTKSELTPAFAVFPLLRFLQIKPFYAWADFRNHVVVHEKKRPDLAGRKTQAILRTCLLRRKKDSKLDGKDLITLPPKTTELRVLEFTEEEREICEFGERARRALALIFASQTRSLRRGRKCVFPLLTGVPRLTRVHLRATFNKYLRQGTVLRNYAHVSLLSPRPSPCPA